MYSKSSVCHHRTQVLDSQKNSGNKLLITKMYFTSEIRAKLGLINELTYHTT